MYYYDFYNEPSEFEMQIDEFKESLYKAVKEEYQSEMERLRKENSELRDVKKRMTEIEREHESKISELKLKKQNLLAAVRRERLSELMRENFCEAWIVKTVETEKPKCNKCDDNRRLYYKTPLGRETYEYCTCNTPSKSYIPAKTECYHFERYVGRNDVKTRFYYLDKSGRDYDSFDKISTMYNGEPLKEIKRYSTYFLTQENCQEYCDWLNEQEAQNET